MRIRVGKIEMGKLEALGELVGLEGLGEWGGSEIEMRRAV